MIDCTDEEKLAEGELELALLLSSSPAGAQTLPVLAQCADFSFFNLPANQLITHAPTRWRKYISSEKMYLIR